MLGIQILTFCGVVCLALAQQQANTAQQQQQQQQQQVAQSPALLDLLAARDQRLLAPTASEVALLERARYNRPLTPAVATGVLSPSAGIVAVRSENENTGDGNFRYGYELSDGQQAQVQGFLKANPEARAADGEDAQIQVIQGSYSYVSPEGIPITVNYIADENGFRVSGSHIPASAGVFTDLNAVPTNLPRTVPVQPTIQPILPIQNKVLLAQEEAAAAAALRLNNPYNRYNQFNTRNPLAYNPRTFNNNQRYLNQNQVLLANNINRPLA